MGLPFPFEGYRLRESFRSERPYLLRCMRESLLGSVSDIEVRLNELWMDQTLNVVNSYMDSIISKNTAYVLERDDGKKAGMLWLEESKDQFTGDSTGYLLGLYVEEEFRGIGLGRALIESAEQWCRERGLLSLTLNVGAFNTNAHELYDHMGFLPRSTVMRKDLI